MSTGVQYDTGVVHEIRPRGGVAVRLARNQTIMVTNTHGTQVIDFWFVVLHGDSPSHLSMSHSRASTLHLSPLVGDVLVSNHRQPMMQFIEDTTPAGIHDTLIAACDIHRYRQLGVPEGEYHNNCTDNYREALGRDVGVQLGADVVPPDPFNLFMNIPIIPNAGPSKADDRATKNVTVGAKLEFEAPVCRPGDFVKLKSLVDNGIVVMSACPQDVLMTNNQEPTSAAFRVDDP